LGLFKAVKLVALDIIRYGAIYLAGSSWPLVIIKV
jgi:hypothetical protein